MAAFIAILQVLGVLFGILVAFFVVAWIIEWFDSEPGRGEKSPYTRRTLRVLSTPTLFSVAKALREALDSELAYLKRIGISTNEVMSRIGEAEKNLGKVEKELRRRGSETP